MRIYFKGGSGIWFITVISFSLNLKGQTKKLTKNSRKRREKHSRLKETTPKPYLCSLLPPSPHTHIYRLARMCTSNVQLEGCPERRPEMRGGQCQRIQSSMGLGSGPCDFKTNALFSCLLSLKDNSEPSQPAQWFVEIVLILSPIAMQVIPPELESPSMPEKNSLGLAQSFSS